MDVSFPSSCGGGHGRLDRDFLEQVGQRPGDASPITRSRPSIDTLGKVKNDRWASAGLSKIAHMHASEFSEARPHCNVVPERLAMQFELPRHRGMLSETQSECSCRLR